MYNKKWSRLEDFNLLYLKLYKEDKHSEIGNKIKRSFTSVQTRASYLKKQLKNKYGFPSPNDFKNWTKPDIMSWLIKVNDGEKWNLNMDEYFPKPGKKKEIVKMDNNPVNTTFSEKASITVKENSDYTIPANANVVIVNPKRVIINNK